APARLFSQTHLGCDETGGRYADVTVWQCRCCSQSWLRYAVEYEAFSRSGRWARGKIDSKQIPHLEVGSATDFLARLDKHLYGGSYFDGRSGERSGPMHWGL